jgi:DNA-directed RNA polymerase subunit RPC12/RpoP
MIQMQCPKCAGTVEAPEDLAGRTTQCPRCRQRVLVPLPAIIHLVCPECRVKMGVPGRLAGESTRCGQCGARVLVPWPDPDAREDESPPPVPLTPEQREGRSTWAWGGMFVGLFVPAGLLLVVGVLLDWHHRPDRSSVLLAAAVVVAGLGAGTGFLAGAIASVVRLRRPWRADAGQAGLFRGGLCLGAFAGVGGALGGVIQGFALLQQAVEETVAAPGTATGGTFLYALAAFVFTPLAAGLVGAALGAVLGRVLGALGGYD